MTKGKWHGWWRKSWVRRALITAGVLGFLALSVAAILWVPGFFVDSAAGSQPVPPLTTAQRVTAVTNARQGVLFIVGGLIAVFTLLITLAKHNLDRDANRTTRYTEAIKQLGDKESLAVRLGGIYALERIAQDSERDRQTILDVLCAYLLAESPNEQKTREEFTNMKSDTAAAAIAMGRITQLHTPKNAVALGGANLTSANLTNADLTGSKLNHANLFDANLTGANLIKTKLIRTNFREADLTSSVLVFADLTKANLTKANLLSADLRGADLTEANLYAANLTNADLTDAYLLEPGHLDTNPTVVRKRVLLTKAYLRGSRVRGLDTVKGLPR